MEFERLAVLEDTYALRILVALNRYGPTFRSVLYGRVSNSTTAPMRRINSLIAAGLLEEIENEYPPFSKTIKLTSKGEKVAELISKMEEILKK
jgi:DNA-binding HxlR family transcriptional regulator